MHTETIAGLHKCQPKNEPKQGETKNMVVLNMPAKNGKKAWIKIKSEKPEKGGSPYRILTVDKLDWPPDDYGNIAFNLEVEPSSSPQTAFQQARSAMSKDEVDSTYDRIDATKAKGEHFYNGQGVTVTNQVTNVPQSPPVRSNGGDGVKAARERLCQVANLYALCVRCANSRMIAEEIPDDHKRNEQFQSTLASIWVYMSSRRSDDGVTWWDYTDRMPTKPIDGPNQPKSKSACTCENTDGDNPLCPVHSE